MDTLPEEIKSEIWSNIEEHQTIFVATVDGDQPRVRPLTMVQLDDKFWILTGTSDLKIKQLKVNPKVEACMTIKKGDHTGYVRFAGKVEMVTDKKIKKNIAGSVSYFSEYWKGFDDPNYTLLEMDFDMLEYMKPGVIIGKKYKL